MIPSLPEELLILILEHCALRTDNIFSHPRLVQQKGDPRQCLTTLSNACLASKSFHRLAWPILYRHFSNRKRSDLAKPLEPAQFLQTICTKLDYGLALRSLSIAEWAPIGAMDPIELFEMLQSDATLVDLFQWRAKTFWLGDDQISVMPPGEEHFEGGLSSVLLRSLEMGLPEAHAVVLLLLCPRLKTLEIVTPSHFETSMIARLLDKVLSENYKEMALPETVHDFEQEESDYAIAQMFGAPWPAPALQKPNMFQDLVTLAIRGTGRCPSGFGFFKKLISLPSLQNLILTGLRAGSNDAIRELATSVPRTRLKTLSIQACQLLTSEASSIIQCCPDLLTLEMTWLDLYDRSHDESTDMRLQFGYIVDAIATHAPKLTSLHLCAGGWPLRHFSSEYPCTVGSSLQHMKHIKSLTLDHHMIYGPQHVEDLLPDDYCDTQSGTNPRVLGRIVPNTIEGLSIQPSRLTHIHDGGLEPADDWQAWQLDDLHRFLQDDSFKRMNLIWLALGTDTSDKHIDADVVAKYGWEVSMGLGKYCKLENRRRGKSTSVQNAPHGA